MAPLLFFTLFLCFSHFVSSQTSKKSTYIIRVDKESMPSVFSEAQHWYQSTLQSLQSNTNKNTDSVSQTNQLLHVYKTVINGFSAKLTPQQAELLSSQLGVTDVLPDQVHQVHTTRSPYFLGLYSDANYKFPGNLLNKSNSGSKVIIGMIDTGIWPEHRSFSDKGMESIPRKWNGVCEFGGPKFAKSKCNKKIIGARFFAKGAEAAYGKINASEEYYSARDSEGHGTHTSSTAAGTAVAKASLSGYAEGTAVGVAPKAHIAMYKACWKYGCWDSDILSAFDKALEDGVDIISISIGGGPDRWSNLNAIAIAAYGAMDRGVFVSASSGNNGPDDFSISNAAPWVTTVGASTIDRRFPADLVLGDGRVLKGTSLYSGKPLTNKWYGIIYKGPCNSLKAEDVLGKIVVCLQNDGVSIQEEYIMGAGGVAIVYVIDMAGLKGEDSMSYAFSMPGLVMASPAGRKIYDYTEHMGTNARATIVFHGTVVGINPAPMVASISSRGPTTVTPFIIKPDLIAPGINILAAWNYGMSPTGSSSDQTRTEFNIISGTSMACPHVSGVAALLKGAHPEWTPAMIRSAMMTTAYTGDNLGQPILDDNDYTTATVWDMGAGHVYPEKALDPGLVYDITSNDYFNFLCASKYSIEGIRTITNSKNKTCGKSQSQPWNLNYPAITVDFKAYNETEIWFTRTVTNVGEGQSVYNVEVVNPNGVEVTVNPMQMTFNGIGDKQNYSVRINAQKLTMAPGESMTNVGKLVWSDKKRNVVSPVVVMWQRQVY